MSWKSHTLPNFASHKDINDLMWMTFDKQRSDTTLLVTFSAVIRMVSLGGCSEWYIKLNCSECTDPAPIVLLINTQVNRLAPGMIILFPTVLSGFCHSISSGGYLGKGRITISSHVRGCNLTESHRVNIGFDSHTQTSNKYRTWKPGPKLLGC